MAEIKLYSKEGKELNVVELNPEVFESKINTRLLELVTRLYANNKRTGNAHTKTRAEVRGGSKKPWRQKGTGRARVSSIRSPLWRGGGTVFGPRKRDIYNIIPKKIKIAALKSAIVKKLKENTVVLIDDLNIESNKTKDFYAILNNLNISKKNVLFIASEITENIERATGNIKKLCLKRVNDVNAYNLLRKNIILLDQKSLEILEKRILSVSKIDKAVV